MLWFPEWWNDIAEGMGLPPTLVFLVVGFLIWGYLKENPLGEKYAARVKQQEERRAQREAAFDAAVEEDKRRALKRKGGAAK